MIKAGFCIHPTTEASLVSEEIYIRYWETVSAVTGWAMDQLDASAHRGLRWTTAQQSKRDAIVVKLSAQLKWNWNKTVSKLFWNCFVSVSFQLGGQFYSRKHDISDKKQSKQLTAWLAGRPDVAARHQLRRFVSCDRNRKWRQLKTGRRVATWTGSSRTSAAEADCNSVTHHAQPRSGLLNKHTERVRREKNKDIHSPWAVKKHIIHYQICPTFTVQCRLDGGRTAWGSLIYAGCR